MNNPAQSAALALLAKSQQVVEQAVQWQERNQSQIDAALRSINDNVVRGTRFIEEHRTQIETVLDGLSQVSRLAEQVEDEWDRAGVGYLVAPLGMAEQLMLSLHAAPGDVTELLDFFEAALADPIFVTSVAAAIDAASALSDVPREHLKHGFSHLAAGESFHAWPPLILGLEGAFTDVALDQQILVRVGNHIYLADAVGNALTEKAPSVEGVARLLGHAPADTDYGAFLIRQVYGGDGNPFRHGVAQEGVRDRVLCLAVAVVGWLDAFVTPGAIDLLRGAVHDELVRRDSDSETEGEA